MVLTFDPCRDTMANKTSTEQRIQIVAKYHMVSFKLSKLALSTAQLIVNLYPQLHVYRQLHVGVPVVMEWTTC